MMASPASRAIPAAPRSHVIDPCLLAPRQSCVAVASAQSACFLLFPFDPLPSSLDPLLSRRVAPPFFPHRPPFGSSSPSPAGLPSPAWRSHDGSRGAATVRIEPLLPLRHLNFSLPPSGAMTAQGGPRRRGAARGGQ
jgi:hypothetical protein